MNCGLFGPSCRGRKFILPKTEYQVNYIFNFFHCVKICDKRQSSGYLPQKARKKERQPIPELPFRLSEKIW